MSNKQNDELMEIAVDKVDDVLENTGWKIDPKVREMLIQQEFEKLLERSE